MAGTPVLGDASSFVCHQLNMGRTRFGDCIVVRCGGKTILIDGGHPGDDKDREDRPSDLEAVDMKSGDLERTVGINRRTGKIEWSQG